MSGSGLSATVRVHNAISRSLEHRCKDIEQIFQDFSLKELHSILPLLLESIFGFNNQPGWGVNKIHKNHSQDFRPLRDLLSPDGPLFNLIYKLLGDPSYFKYEFHVQCLPFPSRKMIEEGGAPTAYDNKIQYHHANGRPYNMITLNAFEFYFFHFSYFMVNPQANKTIDCSTTGESLYTVLFGDYLDYFLPLKSKTLPPPLQQYSSPGRSPVSRPIHRESPSGRPQQTGLLRNSFFSPVRVMSPSNPVMNDCMEDETWRSRTFIQIIVEFWLNQNSNDCDRFSASQSQMSPDSNYSWNHPYWMAGSFLPREDHVKLVRMMIKHLHHFANSSTIDVVKSQYSSSAITPLEGLKRIILPHFVQKKMYAFLKHGFKKWPLDSSFYVVLETWLSYIQPWRYTESRTPTKEVGDEWFKFISENLLFYVTLFHEFVSRLLRMDLTSEKNARLVFRVCKVLSLENLKTHISEAENLWIGYHPSSPDIGASYISPAVHNSIVQQCADLEGPTFQYIPMFSEETYNRVLQVIQSCQNAKCEVWRINKKAASQNTSSNSFWKFLMPTHHEEESYLNPDSVLGTMNGRGLSDDTKTMEYLKLAVIHLCSLYEIQPPSDDCNMSPDPIEEKDQPPEYTMTPNGPQLTEKGRYQLKNGLRKFEIEYQGDPDLQPIRSFEVPLLVRGLYRFCSMLNEKYKDQIKEVYEREDFVGKVAKVYLHPPSLTGWSPVHKKNNLYPPTAAQMEWKRKPRISLRWLAHKQTLGFLLLFYFILYMNNYGILSFVFCFLLLTLLYGVLKALIFPTVDDDNLSCNQTQIMTDHSQTKRD